MGFFDRVIGPRLTPDEIGRRQVATPQVKAELGAQAIQAGYYRGDRELRQIGAAMVVSAYAAVEETENGVAPVEVAKAVTEIAATLPGDAVTENPFIPPEKGKLVASMLEERPRDNGLSI